MLLIAIPKSASTSLLETLGQIHGCHAEQVNFFELPVHPDYKALARFHWDQHELTPEIVDQLVDPHAFNKNHIVPTRHNQTLLAEHRKVILLREPTEIIRAYRRAVRALDTDMRKVAQIFAGCDTQSDWLARAESIGLLQSLQRFYDNWQQHAGNKLIVRFDDLITEPKAVVNRIEDYFGLNQSDQVNLVRTRYTRTPLKNATKRMLQSVGLLKSAEKIHARLKADSESTCS